MKKNSPIAPHRTSSDGPPATLPGDMETSFEGQHDYVTIDLNTSSLTDSQSSMEYDHVKSKKLNIIPRLKDANVVLTQGEFKNALYLGRILLIISDCNHAHSYGISQR